MYGNDDQINSEAAGQLAAKVAMLVVTVDAAIEPGGVVDPDGLDHKADCSGRLSLR